jgi:hypothetical protein
VQAYYQASPMFRAVFYISVRLRWMSRVIESHRAWMKRPEGPTQVACLGSFAEPKMTHVTPQFRPKKLLPCQAALIFFVHQFIRFIPRRGEAERSLAEGSGNGAGGAFHLARLGDIVAGGHAEFAELAR